MKKDSVKITNRMLNNNSNDIFFARFQKDDEMVHFCNLEECKKGSAYIEALNSSYNYEIREEDTGRIISDVELYLTNGLSSYDKASFNNARGTGLNPLHQLDIKESADNALKCDETYAIIMKETSDTTTE